MTIRKIQFPASAKVVTAQTQKLAQQRYFIKLIRNHPKYRLLINSLKEGIKATEIAAHFAENGWLHVNERTFTEAIRVYKNMHPEAIDLHAIEGLDAQVDPNQPQVDLKQQLQQLLRMQRLRIGIGLRIEAGSGFLSAQVPKEIEQTVKIIETIGKLDGKISDGGNSRMNHEDHSVVENLNRIKRDQTTRDRLHSAAKQLVEVKS